MKTHFRKVFKSDHLGVADLEEYKEEGMSSFIFTIREVRQEIGVAVAGRKGNYNIAYFKNNKIKPLVLNATNSSRVRSFAGGSPFVEDWKNISIELYIDSNVKMKGEIVGGVRINPVQPKPKEKPIFTELNFGKAKENNATIEQIKGIYTISNDIEKKYLEYGTKE